MNSTYHLQDFATSHPAMAVVEAVAEEKGVNQLDLAPLGETIDVQKLEKLVLDDEEIALEFSYEGYEITVESDGRILIY